MDADELHEEKRRNVKIRYREYVHPLDYTGVANINSASLIVSFTYLYEEFYKKNPDLFIVAENELNKKIIGFILVEKNPRNFKKGSALVYAIAAHPGYKRLGIGSGLIRNVTINLRYNHPKIRLLYLHVQETNEEAITFYKNFGFKEIKFLKEFYSWGENAYQLALDINEYFEDNNQ
ncbi:MAG: N-acetyltransferase [Candidatus Lokiarchaeota archaeon]|nr:N-acetyltransferase [Candidatus Lokiarchaeota archaeon]